MKQNKALKKKKNFFTKYQIRILTQDFKEIGIFHVSKLDIYALVGSVIILTIIATVFVFSYTSLADLLPGFASPETKEISLKNRIAIENLKNELRKKEQFANNLRLVLQGKDPIVFKEKLDSARLASLNLNRTKQDSLLRTDVEMSENYKLEDSTEVNDNIDFLYLFTPMKGDVISKFNPEKKKNWVEVKYFYKQMLYSPFDGIVKNSSKMSNGNYVITISNNQGLEAKFSNVPKILKDKKQKIFSGEIIGILTPKFRANSDIIYFSLKKNNKLLDPLNNVDF
jgi:hypothetical protein